MESHRAAKLIEWVMRQWRYQAPKIRLISARYRNSRVLSLSRERMFPEKVGEFSTTEIEVDMVS
jgi:hypothetical protein